MNGGSSLAVSDLPWRVDVEGSAKDVNTDWGQGQQATDLERSEALLAWLSFHFPTMRQACGGRDCEDGTSGYPR